MKIKVTQEHLDAGKAEDCFRCPVALAVYDAFPDATRVLVTGMSVHVTLGQWRYTAQLLSDVTKFICGFDTGNIMKPFEFEMEFWTKKYVGPKEITHDY